MKKNCCKTLCLILSLLMLLSLLPVTAMAAAQVETVEAPDLQGELLSSTPATTYTVLGDSIAAGYSLPDYISAAKASNSDMAKTYGDGVIYDGYIVPGSYAQIICDELGVNGCSHARCGWRTAELLTALGKESAQGSDSDITWFLEHCLTVSQYGNTDGVMADEKVFLEKDIQNAGFITVNYGANDIFTYALCCTIYDYAMKGGLNISIPDLSQIKGLDDLLTTFVKLLGLVKDATEVVNYFFSKCEEGLQCYKSNLRPILDTIYGLNPTAQVFVLSVDNPVKITVKISKDLSFDLYTLASTFVSRANAYAASVCSGYANCTYVDVTGAPYFGIQNSLQEVDLSAFGKGFTSIISAAIGVIHYVHPDETGHRYIADKLLPVIKAKTAIPTAVPTAELNSLNQPVISWDKVDGAVSYRVYRSAKPDSGYTLLCATPLTECLDLTTLPGHTYYYKVITVTDLAGTQRSGAGPAVEVTTPSVELVNSIFSESHSSLFSGLSIFSDFSPLSDFSIFSDASPLSDFSIFSGTSLLTGLFGRK